MKFTLFHQGISVYTRRKASCRDEQARWVAMAKDPNGKAIGDPAHGPTQAVAVYRLGVALGRGGR